ncbi:MAG: PucR family transcriptional regulator, partial [Rhodococcus sp. (in: high G+C Gram-positive bacteria)]
TNPRDAYVLRIAATVGRLTQIDLKSNNSVTSVTSLTSGQTNL